MLLGFRTKLKVNNKLATKFAQHAGFARFVYNWGVALIKQAWNEKLYPSVYQLKKLFTNFTKKNFPCLASLSSRVYQFAFQDLQTALGRLKKKISKFPKFKKKNKDDSFTLDKGGKLITISGTKIKLPFIGFVQTYEQLPNCQVKKVTLSKEIDGWYISFAFEQDRKPRLKTSETFIGVDLGVKELATLSNGSELTQGKVAFMQRDLGRDQRVTGKKRLPCLRAFSREVIKTNSKLKLIKQRITRLQYLGRRKQKNSNNKKKLMIKIAKLYQKARRMRLNLLHKLTTYLVTNFEVITIEDLNVSGMVKNHKLAEAVSNQGFSEFREQLEYKTGINGNKLIIADRFYPSSKTCSGCGTKKEDLKLSERIYCCEVCHLKIDRDLNAAINLEKLGRLAQVQASRQDSPVVT
jgi:putative transposase